jgi:glutamate formiminotransferase
VIQAIVAAMTHAGDVQLLDVQSDVDHNRTVVTLIGPPQPIAKAAYRGVAKAAELIDMNTHSGGHPRMGATDVVPFVPVRATSMDECVELAHQLGQRVGAELEIPVYLYEAAAIRPERRNLANVRRGEFEGLKHEIGTNLDRAPDYGPSAMGKAGATAVGARPPLIAFNVYLNTSEVGPAKAIAKAVRHSSGGLRYVKAIGLVVEGQAQVSMNLIDHRLTPIHRVVELIRAEASRYGLLVTHTEVVGLLPAQSLIDAALSYLQLHSFSTDQVLENRLIGDH